MNTTEAMSRQDESSCTGCSTGFGLELAKVAIEHGYRIVVTARDPPHHLLLGNDALELQRSRKLRPRSAEVLIRHGQRRDAGWTRQALKGRRPSDDRRRRSSR